MSLRHSLVTLFVLCLGIQAADTPTPTQREQAKALYLKALTAQTGGTHDEAVRLLREAITLAPEPVFHYALAQSLEKLGKAQAALAAYKEFVNGAVAKYKSVEDHAVPVEADSLEADVKRIYLPDARRRLAELLPKLSDVQEKLVREIDDHLKASELLADDSTGKLKVLGRAIEMMGALRKLQPNYLPVLGKLGAAYEQRKDYALAGEAYASYLDGYDWLGYPPEDRREVRVRVIAFKELAKPVAKSDTPVEDLPVLSPEQKRLLSHIEDHLEAAKRIGDTGAARQTEFNTAIDKMEALRKLQPKYLPLLKKLGNAYEQKGEYLKAANVYQAYLDDFDHVRGLAAEERREVCMRWAFCNYSIPPNWQPLSYTEWKDSQLHYSAQLASNAKLVATYSFTGLHRKEIQVYDTASGNNIATLQVGQAVWDVTFSSDAQQMAASDVEGSIRIWDVATWNETKVLKAKGPGIAFSPDGKAIYSSHKDKVYQWDCVTGESKPLKDILAIATAIAHSADGKFIAIGESDGGVQVWNTSKKTSTQRVIAHKSSVQPLAFAPDGKTLASGSWDSTIQLWDVATGKRLRTFSGDEFSGVSVAFSPDGCTLATGGSDKTVRLWDVATGKNIETLGGHKNRVRAVSFSADGKTLISVDGSGIRVWKVPPPKDK